MLARRQVGRARLAAAGGGGLATIPARRDWRRSDTSERVNYKDTEANEGPGRFGVARFQAPLDVTAGSVSAIR